MKFHDFGQPALGLLMIATALWLNVPPDQPSAWLGAPTVLPDRVPAPGADVLPPGQPFSVLAPAASYGWAGLYVRNRVLQIGAAELRRMSEALLH